MRPEARLVFCAPGGVADAAMRNVAIFSTPDEAHMAVSRLEIAGIGAVIPDDLTLSQNYAFANILGGVRVQVPEDDFETARAILGLKPAASSLLHCPHCQSEDVRVRPLGARQGLAVTLNLPLIAGKITADCRSCHQTFEVPRSG